MQELEVADVAPATVLVHPILTGMQAELVHQALIALLNSPEGNLAEDQNEEQEIRKQLSELTYFFDSVVAHPEKFGLRSQDDTKRIARAHRAMTKGPAQAKPQNRRKERQSKRMSHAKRRRKNRKADAENYNQALAKTEADMREAQEAYEAAQQRMIDRFEALAKKETLSNEEVQEVIELFGSPEGAARMRELRREDDPQRRLDRAAEGASSSISSRPESD